MALNIYISEDGKTALEAAAIALVERFKQEEGETYSPDDIQKAVVFWFEITLEELATEALFHCAEGDRSVAVGRYHFERAMKRIKPMSQEQASSGAVSEVAA